MCVCVVCDVVAVYIYLFNFVVALMQTLTTRQIDNL